MTLWGRFLRLGALGKAVGALFCDYIQVGLQSSAAILVLASLTGCSPGSDLKPLPAVADHGYRLGTGDQIRIVTYDEVQLSGNFSIAADGTIAFPLVGNVKSVGLTPEEVASTIALSLERLKLIAAPSVSVQVSQYRPISIIGEVNSPGQYAYQPGMTMLDAVALARGFTYEAVTTYAGDWRNDGKEIGKSTEGKIFPSTVVQPGDVITVFERVF